MKEEGVIVKVNPIKNNAVANVHERAENDNGLFLESNGTCQLSFS
jgi:hypothetical protein